MVLIAISHFSLEGLISLVAIGFGNASAPTISNFQPAEIVGEFGFTLPRFGTLISLSANFTVVTNTSPSAIDITVELWKRVAGDPSTPPGYYYAGQSALITIPAAATTGTYVGSSTFTQPFTGNVGDSFILLATTPSLLTPVLGISGYLSAGLEIE